jgi:fumarate reductase subunit D
VAHSETAESAKNGRSEALWYGLFAAGGMLTALVAPIHVLLNNLATPLGLAPPEVMSYQKMASLLANPLVKLYLLALISLALFHWAHRFRYILMDLGVMGARSLIAVVAYGTAILGTALGALVLLRVP